MNLTSQTDRSNLTQLQHMLAKAIHDAKRGELHSLIELCRDLTKSGNAVGSDKMLGTALKTLLQHGGPEQTADLEKAAFSTERLRHGWNPENVSAYYLAWKYRRIHATTARPEAAISWIDGARALWPYLDTTIRFRYGLYSKLASCLGVVEDCAGLRTLADDLTSQPLSDERSRTALLRVLNELYRFHRSQEILGVLEEVLQQASDSNSIDSLGVMYVGIDYIRRSVDRLSQYQQFGGFLRRLGGWLEHSRITAMDKRLLTALLHCGDFTLLHRLLNAATPFDNAPSRNTALFALDQLLRYDLVGDTDRVAELLFAQDPGDPSAALALGKRRAAQSRSASEIAALFRSLRRDAPGYNEAIRWLAGLHDQAGELEKLSQWLEIHVSPTDVQEILGNRETPDVCPHLPSSIEPTERKRLCTATLGPFATLLAPLVEVVNGDWSYEASWSVSELQELLTGFLSVLPCAPSQGAVIEPQHCMQAAHELVKTANTHSREMVTQYRSTPLALGPQYGILDPIRVMVLHETLHRIAEHICRYGLEAALADAPVLDVRLLCRLTELHLQSAFEVGDVPSSEQLLCALVEKGIAPMFMHRLLERCALQRGDLQSAREHIQAQPGCHGELHKMTSYTTWFTSEPVESEVIIDQQPVRGSFEYVDAKGNRYTASHTVPQADVKLLRVAGVRIRDTELLIGPRLSIAKPAPWHYRDVYGYPRPSAVRLNYGLNGCRLKPAQHRRHIREPVVVVGNMDGPYYRNYYHWMLLILPRVELVLSRGELDRRRLLIPEELTHWMLASLALIGVPEARLLRYGAEEEMLLDDAWVLTPIEFAAASLLKPLQRRLWRAAGVVPRSQASTEGVWLSRRQQPSRNLVNTEAAEAVARRLGFDVVVPESLSLLDQVRLCARASVIAGPGGANLANLMFAAPNTRVVGVVSESNNYPGFIDLCTTMALHQRWVFGKADPRKARGGPLHEAFEVNLANLEKALEEARSSASERHADAFHPESIS